MYARVVFGRDSPKTAGVKEKHKRTMRCKKKKRSNWKMNVAWRGWNGTERSPVVLCTGTLCKCGDGVRMVWKPSP